MSNIFYYKFVGDDQVYWASTPCTRHFNSITSWSIVSYKIKPVDTPISSYIFGEVSKNNTEFKYSFSDTEWVEYKVRDGSDKLKVAEKYSQLLMESHISPYLKMEDGVAVYRFTPSTSYLQVMFIVALMRYAEEHGSIVDECLKDNRLVSLGANKFLAVLSAQVTAKGNSNHAVFYPPICMRGLFSFLDDVYQEMLFNGDTPIRDSQNWNKINPTYVVKNKFNTVKEYSEYSNSAYSSIDRAIDYFSEEVKVA